MLVKIDLADVVCVDLGYGPTLHRAAPLGFLKTLKLDLNTPVELSSRKKQLLSNNHHTQQTEKQQIPIAEWVFLTEGRRVVPYKTDIGRCDLVDVGYQILHQSTQMAKKR
ncbi:hypothetical protein TU75_24080 [Pseudomonas poae]|nr:hypothetical protein TU75_24080 [Pseudomonas poae]